jgi:hypothetical protein
MPETTKKEPPKPPVTLNVFVQDVIFRTNSLGQAFPIFLLEENYELKKLDIDSILFKNMSVVSDKHYGIGAELKVEFDLETMTPNVLETITPSDKGLVIPNHCSSCDSELLKDKTITQPDGETSLESVCSNFFCPALSRGFLHRLFTIVDPRIEQHAIKLFLSTYPVGNATGSIDSFAEFLFIFKNVQGLNTQPRLKTWIKLHGEDYGNQLFDLENKIYTYVTRSVLPVSDFWDVCNFPKITEKQRKELSLVNPRKVLDFENLGMLELLSKPTSTFIKNNADLVAFLLKFFEEFGEKQWSSLKIA